MPAAVGRRRTLSAWTGMDWHGQSWKRATSQPVTNGSGHCSARIGFGWRKQTLVTTGLATGLDREEREHGAFLGRGIPLAASIWPLGGAGTRACGRYSWVHRRAGSTTAAPREARSSCGYRASEASDGSNRRPPAESACWPGADLRCERVFVGGCRQQTDAIGVVAVNLIAILSEAS